MRIHLHVGPPKTGTSSLQKILLDLYGKEEPQQIWYPIPECMGDGHADMLLRATGFGGRRPEPMALEDVARRAAEAGCQDLIISSEGGAYVALSDQWPQLAALAKYGAVTPIVTLVPIGKRINSFWQEAAKNLVATQMEGAEFREFMAGNLIELRLVAALTQMFPDRATSVIFMDTAEDPGALYRRFAAATGLSLPDEALRGRSEVMNRSLCRLEADIMAGLCESWRRRVGAEHEFRYAQFHLLELFASPNWRAIGPMTPVAFPQDWVELLGGHARAVIAALKAFERSGRIAILGDIDRFDDVARPYKWPDIEIHRGAPMLAASIILLARSHGESLRPAVESALGQTLADFELLIVGDDCDQPTRAVALGLAGGDKRVRFLDLQDSTGERLRHRALGEARGRMVAYLDGYALWLPNHLKDLDALLQEADFAHSLQAGLDSAGNLSFVSCDLANPDLRQLMIADDHKRFDSTFVGHRMDAYRRLPGGWHTIPADAKWPDLAMWRQFLAEPWCRARSAPAPTGISLQTYLRLYRPEAGRAAEMARWHGRMREPDYAAELRRQAAAFLNSEAVSARLAQWRADAQASNQQAATARLIAEQRAEAEGPSHSLTACQADLAGRGAALAAAQQRIGAQAERLARVLAKVAALRARLAQEKARRAKLKKSLAWRWTRPIRRGARWLAAIKE